MVHVVATIAALVWVVVVSDVIDPVLIDKFLVNHPRSVGDNFVNPSAVTNGFAAFGMGHHSARLVFAAEFVGANSHHQVNLGEGELRLPKLEGMSGKGRIMRVIG